MPVEAKEVMKHMNKYTWMGEHGSGKRRNSTRTTTME
jgi:hypothetical protein